MPAAHSNAKPRRAADKSSSLTLLPQLTCPHCWHQFPAEDALWIAGHSDLRGDVKLGESEMRRFLPTRFTASGDAIDVAGATSTDTACPRCHLKIPRSLFELPILFSSILGAPGSGKSYLLTSMVWQARQLLPSEFFLRFADADAAMNRRINEYEEQQFLAHHPERPISLAKTEEQGDLYDRVRLEERTVNFPKPFLFRFGPGPKHRNADRAAALSRIMCLYDNAGESFLPGADESNGPVTGHLGRSEVLYFCFDPTQDPRFRRACDGISSDPQMSTENSGQPRASVRQDSILTEAITRTRRGASLREDQKLSGLLCVLVTKWDSWEGLLPDVSTEPPYVITKEDGHVLYEDRIEETSDAVEELLRRTCPELVTAAESVSEEVIFIPVSATGTPPHRNPETGQLGIRPADIQPRWAEVPILYAIARRTRGLVGVVSRERSGNQTANSPLNADSV